MNMFSSGGESTSSSSTSGASSENKKASALGSFAAEKSNKGMFRGVFGGGGS